MAVRILLVDDHDVVRSGVRAILGAQPEWEICAEAANGREAVEQAKKLKPDVVIMDISMPELNGIGATRHIMRELPKTEVLILTMYESERLVREVLDAGARGYVLKSDAMRDLVSAVDLLTQHKPAFTSKVSEMMLRGYLNGAAPKCAHDSRLSAREQEIVQLLAEGKSNKEVALALSISVKTAETHRRRIMTKLNLRSVGELVRYAVRNGIVEA
ncbi:MAG: DNA-binding response regulator [Acidobacteria bacterium]|jgi:DNA-binding NarL/FixJ family response regulator|nr:MAG: DNA-binding response regulator [Acidobacteriota bacterium]